MNVLKVLHREKKKLLLSQEKIEGQIHGIQAAINALNGRPHKLKGKKLSAAHRRAIKEGIRKAKAARK
jgi:DNA-binding FrmR family transcriptional regulator